MLLGKLHNNHFPPGSKPMQGPLLMDTAGNSYFFVVFFRWGRLICVLLLTGLSPAGLVAGETLGPEEALRVIVKANAARDLDTMFAYMSHDADAVGYTIDGHKCGMAGARGGYA